MQPESLWAVLKNRYFRPCFIPDMLVFSQKFTASSLFGSTIACITLTDCTDNLFGDPGSTFPFWQRSF